MLATVLSKMAIAVHCSYHVRSKAENADLLAFSEWLS